MYIPSLEEQNQIIVFITANKETFIRLIRKNVSNAESYDIEECISRLYLTTLENYDTYKSSPNQTGWLFLTLKNISSDYMREKKKDDKLVNESIDENEYKLKDNFTEDDLIFSILTNHLPEEALIEIILSELTEKEQLLFELRFKRHAEYADIAKRLRQSQSGVRRQISQLKHKITDIIHNGKLFEYVKNKKQ
jgi:RNA polymerase sigma factor (sigma-70 family)